MSHLQQHTMEATSTSTSPSPSSLPPNVPIGWENRLNSMSEKDIQLGGVAANHFSNRRGQTPMNAYNGDATGVYKSSEDVRKHYYQLSMGESHSNTPSPAHPSNNSSSTRHISSTKNAAQSEDDSVLPTLWADRQKERDIQAKQFGVYRHSQNKPSLEISSTPTPVESSQQPKARSQQAESTSSEPAAITTTATSTTTTTTTSSSSSNHHYDAHVALVKVATHTLNTLADTIVMNSRSNNNNNNNNSTGLSPIRIPFAEKAELAKAIQRAMEALAKHS